LAQMARNNGINVNVVSGNNNNVPHSRSLVLKNNKTTIEIRFDGGIAYGWSVRDSNNKFIRELDGTEEVRMIMRDENPVYIVS